MLFPKSTSFGETDKGPFADVSQFNIGFEKPIQGGEGEYLDPSTHDLTGDRKDPEEDRRSKRRVLFCFHCNRMEWHSTAGRHSILYSFLIGVTIGLIKLIGPFYCRCCGHSRFLGWDRIHPKFWMHQRQLNKSKGGRRSRTK